MEFDTKKEALDFLKDTLHGESNYNYRANKNNTYALYKVVYNENTTDYDYHEILPKISIKEYRDMNGEEKDLYFNENLSLSEISNLKNVSKSYVGKIINESEKKLDYYENNIGYYK